MQDKWSSGVLTPFWSLVSNRDRQSAIQRELTPTCGESWTRVSGKGQEGPSLPRSLIAGKGGRREEATWVSLGEGRNVAWPSKQQSILFKESKVQMCIHGLGNGASAPIKRAIVMSWAKVGLVKNQWFCSSQTGGTCQSLVLHQEPFKPRFPCPAAMAADSGQHLFSWGRGEAGTEESDPSQSRPCSFGMWAVETEDLENSTWPKVCSADNCVASSNWLPLFAWFSGFL